MGVDLNVLLSGASGFIGRHIINSENVSYISRYVLRREIAGVSNDKVFIIDGIDCSTNWFGAFANIDSVIHLAGVAHNKSQDIDEINTVNTLGALRFAREAASNGVKRFLYLSTNLVSDCDTNSDYRLVSTQTLSKYKTELGLKKIAAETGMELVIIRSTLVYGPNAPGNVGLLTRLITQFPILPFGKINNKRNFIAVQNLVDLMFICAKHPQAAGNTFLASDGDSVSIKEFTNAIAKGMGKTVLQLPIPISFMRLVAKCLGKPSMVEQLVGDLQVDSSNLKDILEWQPPYTMEQAMAFLSENT